MKHHLVLHVEKYNIESITAAQKHIKLKDLFLVSGFQMNCANLHRARTRITRICEGAIVYVKCNVSLYKVYKCYAPAIITQSLKLNISENYESE